MSDVARGSDWWLASDGKWYPPSSRPAPAGPPLVADRASMSTGLTTATAIAFLFVALLSVIAALLRFREAARFQQWRDAGFNDADASRALGSAERASYAAYLLSFWAGVTVFVLTVIWLYRAKIASERFGGTQMRWSPGWAVGGWFIPAANAVIPKLVLHEVERVSGPDGGAYPVGDRWRTGKLRADGWIWWLSMLAGTVMVLVGMAMSEGGYPTGASFDADGYRRGLYVYGIGFLVVAVSAVAGAITIRRLGTQLNRSLVPIGASAFLTDLVAAEPERQRQRYVGL